MAEKKGFLLRISPETLAELERWAQAEFRSVNGQIEYLLAEALRRRRKSTPKDAKDTKPDAPGC
ncbi:ribbon-helix-helix domain-containing protein [Fibrella aquatilis]|uniref:Arc family DNA-binding protein n=1 Tax=Fibrella aquatilis TaxID=2817059 RepID=A0A939G2C8_9BACT|nr:Arc family DNA-binding protein [Fibrella aquatilis]MBO0930616.1 Arc family DNA-binding protein [Fibrella aquatilis]